MGLFSKKNEPVWAGSGKKAKTEGMGYVKQCNDLEELKLIAQRGGLNRIQDAAIEKIYAIDRSLLKGMFKYSFDKLEGPALYLNTAIINKFSDDEEFMENILFNGRPFDKEKASVYITSKDAMVKCVMEMPDAYSFDFLAVKNFVDKIDDEDALKKLVELYENYKPFNNEFAPHINDKRDIYKKAKSKLK